MELRRKNKTIPTEIKPPANPEEWISKANADGEQCPRKNSSVISDGENSVCLNIEGVKGETIKRDSISRLATPVVSPSKYISFSIDNITLDLFRELSFKLNKGNAKTLCYVIEECTNLHDEYFLQFTDNRVVSGNVKRTMSFLLDSPTIEKIDLLAKRLRFRNKSALYRYLIQIIACRSGVRPKFL